MKKINIKTMNQKLIFGLFFILVAPTIYFYTNCGVVDKVADIWESDPLSARHREIAKKVLNKYRNIYVTFFPIFVADAGSDIYLGRGGNTNYRNKHHEQVLDCIDDALDAYNEKAGSANLYYFNDDERIWGIDDDEGATAVAEGNAVFIPEYMYENALDSFVDDDYTVDESSFILFQTLVHEFNHWNGIHHANELQATHADFINYADLPRSDQLDLFYDYSDTSYYFEQGIVNTIVEMLEPFSSGDLKSNKCLEACKDSTIAKYDENYPLDWEGEVELDWYGISQSEYISIANNMCTNYLIDPARATDSMNVCGRQSSVVQNILNYYANLCSCQELDADLLNQVRNITIDNQSVLSVTKNDLLGLNEALSFSAENNQITRIEADLFGHHSGSTQISFKNNQITDIDTGAFNNLNNLLTLDLSKNNLSRLTDSSLLKDLTSLRYLYLSDNQISSIGTNMFVGLVSLERLDLSGNALTTLPSDFFDICSIAPGLKNIFLQDNDFDPAAAALYEAEAAAKCPSVTFWI